jgi:rhodanese-related sulfurtransferase
VKTDLTSNANHFVLYLGSREGKALLYNPPESVAEVPFYELAQRWNGRVIIMWDEPNRLSSVFMGAVWKTLCGGLFVVVAVVGLRRYLQRGYQVRSTQRIRNSVTQGVAICGVAIAGGLLYHYLHGEGFLAHGDATRAIQRAHLKNLLPKVDARLARKLVNAGSVVVDARFPIDFESKHLDGAINISIDATTEQRQEKLAGVPKNARIIVYCQSSSCPFAIQVARELLDDGYTDILYFKGGWLEWVAAEEARPTHFEDKPEQ